MGCDVHMHYEIKRPDGSWVEHDYRPAHANEVDDVGQPDLNYDTLFKDPLYVHRNYSTFAVLAGVRNGTGQERVDPVARPRGLPRDATDETRRAFAAWGGDSHTPSWLLLTELLNYDWARGRKRSGLVGAAGFSKWRVNGAPDSWWQGGGRGVSNAHMDQVLKDRLDAHNLATRVEWTTRVYDGCREFVERTIPALCRLVTPDDCWPEIEPFVTHLDKGIPHPLPDRLVELGLEADLYDRVRLVFWFDN